MATLEQDFRNPRTALEREIAALGPWFHNLRLPCGTETAPGHVLGDFPSFKWREIEPHLPTDLCGWRALDIGCNAGFYSFKLAERGAAVEAVDSDARYLRQAHWAARRLDPRERVHFRQEQVYALAGEGRSYDLILFLGVFYHLRYPYLVLRALSAMARRLLVFQTLSLPEREIHPPVADLPIHGRQPLLEPGWPRMAFIEHCLAGDPTNWWAPNNACILAMLRTCGFETIEQIGEETYLCRQPAEGPVSVDQETRAILGW